MLEQKTITAVIIIIIIRIDNNYKNRDSNNGNY